MKPSIEGLDTDGKNVLKVVPDQVQIDSDGNIVINNDELKNLLKERPIDADTHIILMGSECGCQCCCC
jgi:hypothetical protein